MSRVLTGVFGLGLGAVFAYAQVTVPNTYGSPTGFGNVLYPGTGKPPQVRYPSVNTAAPGGSRGGVRPGGAIGRGGVGGPIGHPGHQRAVVVPYPVFVGGYGYSAFGDSYSGFDTPSPVTYQDQGAASPQQATPPVVIINQGYRPETANPVLRDYSDANLPETPRAIADPAEREKARAESERPTIYLIAFKDHAVTAALSYWVEGEDLKYITKDGKPNSASLSLVDRELSKQINKQLNLDFVLP